MKKNKLLKTLIVTGLFSLTLSACGGGDSETPSPSSNPTQSQIRDERYDIYQLAVKDGYQGSYEEWLQSIRGADGASILNGSGAPSNGTGKNGDTYVDIASWDIYIKVGGSWSLVGNIMGRQGPTGEAGKDGRSITSITLISSENNIDTYTITYSDGTTSTFTVTNGVDGQQGIQGEPGQDGHTPVITVGSNGNWFVDGVDTGIKAQGSKGDQGEPGPQGPTGDAGKDGKSAYELYCEAHPEYKGTEQEWLDDLINGRLGNKEVHTVTFDTHGGSSIDPQYIYHGEKIVKPADPTRNGAIFQGWTYQGEPWSFIGYVVTEDMILDANWNLIDYTATFVNDDNSVLEVQENVHYGDVLTYKGETPIAQNKEDHYIYTFSGWDKELVVTGDMTFVAQYTKEYAPFTAKYYDASGNVLYETLFKEGETPTYVGDTPAKTSTKELQYEFTKWDEGTVEGDIVAYHPIFAECTNGLVFENGSVSMYVGTSTNVVIPSRWDDIDITQISSGAFCNCTSLVSVAIPNGVTFIGDKAFSNCTSLTSINISESVVSIGDSAFSYCTSLTSVFIPEGVVSIGNNVFELCTYLKSITIPNSVSSIGAYAFCHCTSLISITIPEGVTSIDEFTFYDCSFLTSIVIPDSVTYIGEYAFSYCSSLASVFIPEGVASIGESAFLGCSCIVYDKHSSEPKDYEPSWNGECIVVWGFESVVEVDGYTYALATADSLKVAIVVEFDDSIENFAPPAIVDTYLVKGVNTTIFSKNNHRERLKSVVLPVGTTFICGGAFSNCTSLTSVTIPEGVTSIGTYAFYRCKSLVSLNIPKSISYIGERAFYSCSSLTSVTIPDGVTSIDYCTFRNCTSLTSIIMGNSVTSIGDEAFYNCASLTSINISESVVSIGDSAFRYCTSLTSVVIPDNVTSISYRTFSNCTSLTSVLITDNVTSIHSESFRDCTSLTSINIPEGVTLIGEYAFNGCSSLASIIIPDGVTSISASVFRYCSSLTSIIMGNSVTSIGDEAFYNCTSLTSISIPDSTTSIGYAAFKNCTSLTSVIIGNSVTFIGNEAFYNCSSLTSVVIPSSVTVIKEFAFSNCSSLTSVIIPSCVISIGSWAFSNCDSLTIYCEAQSKPDDWESDWNPGNRPVVWDYHG